MKNSTLLLLLLVSLCLKSIGQTPNITSQTTTICNGQSVTLTGSNIPANSTLQWTLNGTPISGATQSTYQATTTGNYQLIASVNTTNPNPWTFTPPPVEHTSNTSYQSIQFLDTQTGYAVGNSFGKGGVIAKTTNGGANWTSLFVEGGSSTYWDAYFINSQIGWVVSSSGQIKKTINGGTSWTNSSASNNPDLRGVYFVNDLTGWAVGRVGVIIKTTDGGQNWTLQPSGVTDDIHDCFFINDQIGWATENNGNVLKTTNGGASWSKVKISTDRLFAIQFINSQIGWAVGAIGNCFRTTDGGSTWLSSTVPDGYYFADVSFVNSQVGWISSSATETTPSVYKTTDGGVTWTGYPPTNGFKNTLCSHFISENLGWGYGYFAGNGQFSKYSAFLTSQQNSNTITLTASTSIYTLKSGNWTDPTVWSCGAIPTETQNVTLKSGHSIILNNTMGVQKCKNLLVEQGAIFNNTGSYFLAMP